MMSSHIVYGSAMLMLTWPLFRQGGKKIAAKQVSELPFPFQRPEQFERSIRLPVGMLSHRHEA